MIVVKVYKVQVFIYAAVCLGLLKVRLTEAQDWSRCWDQERNKQQTNGGTNAAGVTTVEDCKQLCSNNTLCRGIDWDYTRNEQCWLQFNSGNLPFTANSNITHWTVVNCSALNRCWNEGLINYQTNGGTKADTKSLEDCKHQCLYIETCRGLDWTYTDNSCWLQVDNNNQPFNTSLNITHWSLTNCPPTTTAAATTTKVAPTTATPTTTKPTATTPTTTKPTATTKTTTKSAPTTPTTTKPTATTPTTTKPTATTPTTTKPTATTTTPTATTSTTPILTTPTTTTSPTIAIPTTSDNTTTKESTSTNPTVSGASASSTVNTPPSAPNSTGTPNTAAIIGGVVGGVGGAILIGLIILLVVCIVRRRRRENKDDGKNIMSMEEASTPPLIGNNQKKPSTASKPKPIQLSQPMNLKELSEHFDKLKSSESALKEEFQFLPSNEVEPCTAAKKADGTVKRNRFKNILPYDDSRVKLTPETEYDDNDYINASYIQGFNDTPKSYIAAQGPLSTTLGDFWRMIWNERINRIIMLSHLVETGKQRCEKYWPDGIDNSKAFDTKDLTVTLVDFQVCTDYTKRILSLQHKDENNESETRQITQLQYRIWDDKSVPSQIYSLLEFRRRARQLDNDATGPMLVHCSAGVGRTGSFIALDILLDQAEKNEKISVFGVVEKLRLQRMIMVQVADQYKLLYRALLESPVVGTTNVSRDRFAQTCEDAVDSDGNLDGPLKTKSQQEFRLLQDVKSSSDSTAKIQLGNSKKISGKNTDEDDNSHMYINLAGLKSKSNCIAVRMNGYRFPSRFILSPLPQSDSAKAFWKMIMDERCPTVVILEPPNDEVDYLPSEEGSTVQFGSVSVKLLSTIDSVGIRDSDLYLQADKSTTMTVHLYQLTSWPSDQDLPQSATDILDLITLIAGKHQKMLNLDEDTTASTDINPVTVVCRDGATRSGLYAAASYLIDKTNHDNEVDAYLSCRYVLSSRPEAIISLEQYQYLYKLAVESLTWNSNVQLKLMSRPNAVTLYANVDHKRSEQPDYVNARERV